MRSATAIDQEASTTNSTRLAVFFTRTLRWKSLGSDGKSHPFALFRAFLLERSGCPQGGIKCQVIGLPVGWAGLDVAPAFAVGVGARAATRPFAVQLVQVGIQLARPEGFRRPLLSLPVPPVGIAYVEDALSGRLTLVRTLLVLLRCEV